MVTSNETESIHKRGTYAAVHLDDKVHFNDWVCSIQHKRFLSAIEAPHTCSLYESLHQATVVISINDEDGETSHCD